MSKIAEHIQSMMDRTASTILALTGGHGADEARRQRLLSRVLLGSAVACAGLPIALSTLFAASLALPAGFALAAGLGLLAGGLVLAASSKTHNPAPASVTDRPVNLLDHLAGVVTIHDAKGRVLSTHGRDRTLLIAHRPKPGPSAFLDAIHVSDRIGFLQAVDQLRLGQPGACVELRLERGAAASPAGQFMPVRVELTALADTDGQFSGFMAQTTDMTAETALRTEIGRLTDDIGLAHATKIRFLAAVSHELRTPLNAILGFSEILIGGYFGKLENPRQTEYVGLINQSGNHLLGVVNSMLDMSRIEAGRYALFKEPFPVADVMQSCEDMLFLQARAKGVVLTARATRDIGEVTADRRAVQQILINLVGNAIKFTGKGGVVSMDATRNAAALTITIADTGIGIAAGKISQLGQPFMQVEDAHSRTHEGTGLGLSLVKGLVGLHGGTFQLESVEGEGTVVTISLPIDGCEERSGETDCALDFPPRLMHSAAPATSQEEVGHGRVKAQIA